MKLQNTRITAEIYDAVHDLIAEGYTVSYYHDGRPVGLVNWIIAERDSLAATVSYERIGGYLSVMMPIKPSRVYGSGLLVWGGCDDYALDTKSLVDAVNIACSGELFVNFANDGRGTKRSGNTVYKPLPNDGMGHFGWAYDRLETVTL